MGGWGHGAVNRELVEEVLEVQRQEQVPCRQRVLGEWNDEIERPETD